MTRQRLLPHGGDRRSGDGARSSDQLTLYQCARIISAADEAWARGQPFNRFITLAWELGGIDPRHNAGATRHWLHHAHGFLRQHGERLVHCWVQENGNRYGAHVHMLLHVPSPLDPLFRTKPRHWAKLVVPGPYIGGTIDTQKIAFGSDPEASPFAYQTDLMAKLHYVLKCAPAGYEARLGMGRWRAAWSKDWGRRSIVFGQRIGRWQDRKKLSP